MRLAGLRAWSLLAGILLCSCATTRAHGRDEHLVAPIHGQGVYHTVQRGQTLWRIAQTYAVSVDELSEVNGIEDPTRLRAGMRLWIPRAERVLSVPITATVSEPVRAGQKVAAPATPRVGRSRRSAPIAPATPGIRPSLIWPVQGFVESPFGPRGARQHDGIDIKANKGTPVHAAAAGVVLYAGVQRGYGNLVILKHTGDLITIYAHNTKNLVKEGDRVKQGQTIALAGHTGNATNCHVHFEVRVHRIPKNPLLFLPRQESPFSKPSARN